MAAKSSSSAQGPRCKLCAQRGLAVGVAGDLLERIAEGALRGPVIHRKLSQAPRATTASGSRSGSLCAATTCRLQRRSLFTYLSELTATHNAAIRSPRSPEPQELNAYQADGAGRGERL